MTRCQTCHLGAGLPVQFEWGAKTLHGTIVNDRLPVRTADGQMYLVPREKLEPDPGEWPEGEEQGNG